MLKTLAIALLISAAAFGACVTVTDTLLDARGVPVNGTITAGWRTPFTEAGGGYIAAGQVQVPVAAGVFSVCLFPNTTSTPSSSGTVNTAGTAVTWVSGVKFPVNQSWNAKPITIASTTYSVASVTDTTHLVLTATAGTQTGAAYLVPTLSYTATYNIPNYFRGPETWIVPDGGPYTIQQVFSTAPPISPAVPLLFSPQQISGAGASVNWILGWDGTKTDWRNFGGGAINDPGSNGLLIRTALNVTVARTLIASGLLSWTNPTGVAGNPTVACTLCASTANPLSQFAATTSLQFFGVLTNPTGTGSAVFGTSPFITTPTGIVKADVGLGNVVNSDATNASNLASGTVNAARLPTSVPTSAANDTNVTGVISGSVFTLGWTGVLAKARIIGTAVYNDQSNTYSAGTQNAAAAAHTLPAKVDTTANLPATCTVGEFFFSSNATNAGQNLYFCTATNTWTLMAGVNVTLSGALITGSGSGKSGADYMIGTTSGGAGWAVNDVAGTAILYLMPATNGAAGLVLSDTGVVTCPTLPTTSPTLPAVCHQMTWVSSGVLGSSFVATQESTSSTSYVGLTTPDTTTFTLAATTTVVILNQAMISSATSNSCVNQINIDTADVAASVNFIAALGGGSSSPTVTQYKTSLAAGSHTVKLDYKVSAGTCNWFNRMLVVEAAP